MIERIGLLLAGLLLIGLGAIAAFISWGPLQNLFAEYQDSPVSTYLLFGLPFLFVALVAIAAGIWLVHRVMVSKPFA